MSSRREKSKLRDAAANTQAESACVAPIRPVSRKKSGSKRSTTSRENRVTRTKMPLKRARPTMKLAKEMSQLELTPRNGLEQVQADSEAVQQPSEFMTPVQEADERLLHDTVDVVSASEPAIQFDLVSASGAASNAGSAIAPEDMSFVLEEATADEPILERPSVIVSRSTDSWAEKLALIFREKWTWLVTRIGVRRGRKRLRVCESVSLGEKRFVAVIQVDGEEFLVGGASNSVSTLARLERPREFSDLLQQQWAQDSANA